MKFTILKTITDKQKKEIQNKKVCDVIEYILPPAAGGLYKGWLGSVEDAYFSVTFVKGIVSASVSEREMCLGWKIVNYAVIDRIYDKLTSGSTAKNESFIANYNLIGYINDVDEVTFKDVMTALKWKMKSRNVKVEHHFLNF